MNILRDIKHLLLPQHCELCGCILSAQEECICTKCIIDLPRTNLHKAHDSYLERMFWGQFEIERAASFIHYNIGDSRSLVHKAKYFSNPKVGHYLSAMFAQEIASSGFFEGIDLIVPMPLHWKRQLKRGYNQSFYIAKGIEEVTGIPVCTSVVKRAVNNKSQTKVTHAERASNVKDIFKLIHPEKIAGKHILIVDDVITGGSTITSCAREIMKADVSRISVLSLALASHAYEPAEGKHDPDPMIYGLPLME